VYRVDADGPKVVERREATPEENAALDAAAQEVVGRLAEMGLCAEIVSQRLNRRKVDLIPEPEWADPPRRGSPNSLPQSSNAWVTSD
jgi:hypothetical protein